MSAPSYHPAGLPDLILARLSRLAPNTTLCPGALAKDLGRKASELRPLLRELEASGRGVVSQRGAPADLGTLRGPYRVAPGPR